MPWTSTLTLSSSVMFDYFKVLKKEADVYKTKKKHQSKKEEEGLTIGPTSPSGPGSPISPGAP